MSTPEWVQDAIFYQIFPDRFARSQRLPDIGFESWDAPPSFHGFKGGDLYGVAEKLDYLQDLGITALYLNPIFASASNHRYHTYDYYNVDPLLGGNEAFRHLLTEAHKRDLRVILDGVFNHASRGFWQFHHVLENRMGSPYKDWFYFDTARLQGKRNWGAYPGTAELKAQQSGEDSVQAFGYRGWWHNPALPKFNTNTPAVRRFLFEVAQHWIRFGADGWRLDVPGDIDDDSFWQEFRFRVRQINPEAYIVGEIWDEAQRWLQGDQFDGVMNYVCTNACVAFFPQRHLDLRVAHQQSNYRNIHHAIDAHEFANRIDHLWGLYRPEAARAQMNLVGSHDTPRFLSVAGGDKAALKMVWLFLMTIVGAPTIYYGDEIGLDGEHDPGCRKAFPWEEQRWDQALRQYVRAVTALRRNEPTLRRGDFRRLWSANSIYAFSRSYEGQTVVVAFNVSDAPQTAEVEYPGGAVPKPIFGEASDLSVQEGRLRLTIPPRRGVVLK